MLLGNSSNLRPRNIQSFAACAAPVCCLVTPGKVTVQPCLGSVAMSPCILTSTCGLSLLTTGRQWTPAKHLKSAFACSQSCKRRSRSCVPSATSSSHQDQVCFPCLGTSFRSQCPSNPSTSNTYDFVGHPTTPTNPPVWCRCFSIITAGRSQCSCPW